MKKYVLQLKVSVLFLVLVFLFLPTGFAFAQEIETPDEIGPGVIQLTSITGHVAGVTSSDDGNLVVFSLSSNADYDAPIFMLNRLTGKTTFVGFGFENDVSGDGSCIVMAVYEDHAPTDTNGIPDIYIFDVASQQVVSIIDNYHVPHDWGSAGPTVDWDCSTIAFSSYNAYGSVTEPGKEHVYVHFTQSGSTSLVSQYTSGIRMPNSWWPNISPNGRYIAWITEDVSFGDFNGVVDVFTKDFFSGVTSRVSEKGGKTGNGSSANPVVADNGDVIFISSASDIAVDGDDNDEFSDVYLYDRFSGDNLLITPEDGEYGIEWVDVDADGDIIAIQTQNHMTSDDREGVDIFLFEFGEDTVRVTNFCGINGRLGRVMPDSLPKVVFTGLDCVTDYNQVYMRVPIDYDEKIFLPVLLK